jgi:hypothetical protein
MSSRKKITNPEIPKTIRLLTISLGVASRLKKLVNSISGKEILNMILDKKSFVSLFRIPALAAIAPIITTTARIAICVRTILASIEKKKELKVGNFCKGGQTHKSN